ncbi:MAG: carbohydrate kinase [Lentisphaerae bacterium]|nr:carbohydrate kinase [Lentisphaerota bacterium]
MTHHPSTPLFLGIDVSTQGVKALAIDAGRGVVAGTAGVHFGADLPAYRSPHGFLPHDDPRVRHADPRMWVEGVELALQRLAAAGVPLDQVAGVSGSGQQHGSVYCGASFAELLAGLGSHGELVPHLAGALSRPTSPIWMDRSTTPACMELQAAFGARLQTDTGSPAIERFTGPQIRTFAREQPEAYARTATIHLVSSFLCSLLTGSRAPIDYGDGAGMNLLNLKTLAWDPAIAAFTAPGLLDRLPPCVPSHQVAGHLAAYWSRFGLRPGIPVVLWSGDNPNSLIGVGGGTPGTVVVSLGTSDTLFAAMRDIRTDPAGCGHVFGNPAGGFMSLICFSNGSLAREQVREQIGADWQFFDVEACRQTPPGNGGKLMLPYFVPESTPLVLQPRVRTTFETATPAERVRALLESQALSMRLHSAWQGEAFRRIRVTGGASRSAALVQILADVFQAPVETIAVADSAALGAALRAAQAVGGMAFEELYGRFCQSQRVVPPRPEFRQVYDDLLQAYAAFERTGA